MHSFKGKHPPYISKGRPVDISTLKNIGPPIANIRLVYQRVGLPAVWYGSRSFGFDRSLCHARGALDGTAVQEEALGVFPTHPSERAREQMICNDNFKSTLGAGLGWGLCIHVHCHASPGSAY